MNKLLTSKKNLLLFGIPLSLIVMLTLITKSATFSKNSVSLSNAITVDLLFVLPFIYFLLIRKTNISKTSVAYFLIFGIIIGSFILPKENQNYLNLFKLWVLPIIELSILAIVILNLKNAITASKLNKDVSFDFFTSLKMVLYKVLPKTLVMPVAMEIGVLFYGFIFWKKRELKVNEFTYHKDSGTIALLLAFIFIIAIETFVLHLLLSKWSNTIAWILTLLSAYTCIQIFGFLKSMIKRPISYENKKLYLRYGIMTETTINLENIASIEFSAKDIEINKETQKLSFLQHLESHNVLIRLKEENTIIGFYGIKRNFKILALHVDNKIEFQKFFNNYQSNLSIY